MNWWENIPQCKVGDLVRYKKHSRLQTRRQLQLVVEVNPKVPCRVNPVQYVLCVDNSGREKLFKSKSLEVVSENR